MKTRYFLWSLCSAWMIGIGLRFVLESFFSNKTYPVFVCFDTFFDWLGLFLLGLLLFIFMLWDIKKEYEKKVGK